MSSDFGPRPHGTKVPHPHAESMLLYAQDAMETDRPWERWEYSAREQKWSNLPIHPTWSNGLIYRRKPRTILINGIEVPEPVRKELDCYQKYFVADPVAARPVVLEWINTSMDRHLLERGIIHLTEENARKHAEALLSFTKV